MTPEVADVNINDIVDTVVQQVTDRDLVAVSHTLTPLSVDEIVLVLERLSEQHRAVLYRLLQKDRALAVFELLDPALQGDLLHGLQDSEVAEIFTGLDPDDRVWLLDELPSKVAPRLLKGLSAEERQVTSALMGYPLGSIGRRMSPELISTKESYTVETTMERVKRDLNEAETIYLIPVIDESRHVIGVVSLRQVLGAEPGTLIGTLMQDPYTAVVTEKAEVVARRMADLTVNAMPIVDRERRLVGIFTIDDAVRILELEDSEDAARQGGVEPLRRPYLSTPISTLVNSRIVWLLVLAIGATLTVQVLSVFEDTLAEVTVLALFVPLLIGTGGNTGNQAATTVTRALALDDVRTEDILKVIGREVRVGFLLGCMLGLIGFTITGFIYDFKIGAVIGLTLIAVCTVAATIGGAMPIAAKAIKVDPAVFSNPFITTFVDATGLVLYFLIARAILQI
ncbi:magnesium transporter [Leucobacter chinensis]|uniref:magnesium transporter n=1 Tax=Leucobacter chinensis TaxID=2851010 RepID=UPI001C22919A|nr:magnesium transporter [Leucobacter chinensis]